MKRCEHNTVGADSKPGPDGQDEILLLECPPDPRWFTVEQGPDGKPEVWLRVTVTGLQARRYGPFPDPYTALQALDWLLDAVSEGILEGEPRMERFKICRKPTSQTCRQFVLPAITQRAPAGGGHRNGKEG